MNFVALLRNKSIDPREVLVLRHRPKEPELNKVLPWLAMERPDVFNTYQSTQRPRVEATMRDAKYVASFIGHEGGKAVFVGLYSQNGFKPITRKRFWQIPGNIELKKFGGKAFMEFAGASILYFDLAPTDFYAPWKGKLIVGWPPPDRGWFRWAHKPNNMMPVLAVLDDSALSPPMPEWNEIKLTWEELAILPTRWKNALSAWRGVYFIFDSSDGKGYIGSAYAKENLLRRWQNYSASGHGGNRLLRDRDPKNFHFTILELVKPSMEAADVIRIETNWKNRLHTRSPFGLNDN